MTICNRVPVDLSGEPLLPGVIVKHCPPLGFPRVRCVLGRVTRSAGLSAYVWWHGEKREFEVLAGNLQIVRWM